MFCAMETNPFIHIKKIAIFFEREKINKKLTDVICYTFLQTMKRIA